MPVALEGESHGRRVLQVAQAETGDLQVERTGRLLRGALGQDIAAQAAGETGAGPDGLQQGEIQAGGIQREPETGSRQLQLAVEPSAPDNQARRCQVDPLGRPGHRRGRPQGQWRTQNLSFQRGEAKGQRLGVATDGARPPQGQRLAPQSGGVERPVGPGRVAPCGQGHAVETPLVECHARGFGLCHARRVAEEVVDVGLQIETPGRDVALVQRHRQPVEPRLQPGELAGLVWDQPEFPLSGAPRGEPGARRPGADVAAVGQELSRQRRAVQGDGGLPLDPQRLGGQPKPGQLQSLVSQGELCLAGDRAEFGLGRGGQLAVRPPRQAGDPVVGLYRAEGGSLHREGARAQAAGQDRVVQRAVEAAFGADRAGQGGAEGLGQRRAVRQVQAIGGRDPRVVLVQREVAGEPAAGAGEVDVGQAEPAGSVQVELGREGRVRAERGLDRRLIDREACEGRGQPRGEGFAGGPDCHRSGDLGAALHAEAREGAQPGQVRQGEGDIGRAAPARQRQPSRSGQLRAAGLDRELAPGRLFGGEVDVAGEGPGRVRADQRFQVAEIVQAKLGKSAGCLDGAGRITGGQIAARREGEGEHRVRAVEPNPGQAGGLCIDLDGRASNRTFCAKADL